MLRRSVRFSLVSLVVSVIFAGIAIATEIFGEKGRPGRNGENGASGRSGEDLTIVVDGNPADYDIKGSDGTDGTDGTPGGNARACRAPERPRYSLVGAPGGDGGDGGDGGNGGNGGEVKIFYTNADDLKKIKLDNSGGQAGSAARGAEGGEGCECRETQWDINYCSWQLWKKPTQVANAQWILDSQKLLACTGVESVDEKYHYPELPAQHRNSGWNFKWVYQGVSESKRFECRSGEDGREGSNGRPSNDGKYGEVVLVPRKDIPEEKTSHSAPLSSLIGNKIEIVKNIWVRKEGLRSLLNPSAKVPDSYTYLESTARLNYRVDWKAAKTPAELGISDTEIGASIQLSERSAMLDFSVPGTLEYKTSKQGSSDVLTITGGFSPNRVKSFRVDGVSNLTNKENKLVLVDRGNVKALLKSMTIEIECLTKQSASGITVTDNYQKRYSVKFDIPPTGTPSVGATLSENVYTFDMQRFFGAWLRPGYDVQYAVKITQTTKSGAVYNQSEEIRFQVPK